MKDKIILHFLGAAGTVTGSKYLVEAGDTKVMIDCGMFQGIKKLRLLNWDYPPIDVHTLDAILLTHGHLDHVGYLPRLVNWGYAKGIIGTLPTLDIASIILKDSAMIQEEDARRANEEGFSRHHPAKPLYTLKHVEETLTHFHAEPLDEWVRLSDDISYRFRYNGHILGATFIELDVLGKRMVFSGDVGRDNDLLLYPPKRPEQADIMVLESTYGDRLHATENEVEKLTRIVQETFAAGGTLIIPSFAVERTQMLMYLFWQMHKQGKIPQQPMYMDSPMGANVLDVFQKYPDLHKLGMEECRGMCELFKIVRSVEETVQIMDNHSAKIVIAGSGMVSGGRVLGYLQRYIDDPTTTVMLVGFQAEGTRGRDLHQGAQELKFYGQYYQVRCRVEELTSLSGHADQQGLLAWISGLKQAPAHLFLTHGEPAAADALRRKIKDTYQWEATIPEIYNIVEIPV
jgi:metallo-beta-lactamase family protein